MRVGFPIRKSADQSLLAAPHGLSQRVTSFIASQCQGIHQMPLRRLIYQYHAQGRCRPCGLPIHNIARQDRPGDSQHFELTCADITNPNNVQP